MKRYSYTAFAVFLIFGMTVPHARAASTLFTLGSGGTFTSGNQVLTYGGQPADAGFTLILTGYTCGISVTYCDSVDTQSDSKSALLQQSAGIGMANDDYNNAGVYEIPRNEFVQVDFSVVPAGDTITSIAFNFSQIVDGWDIYKSSVAGEFDSTSGGPAAQFNNGAFSLSQFPLIDSSANGSTGTITSSSAGFYNVSALQADCETVLTSITVNYTDPPSTPEPATCLLMGVALLGLGVVGKKLRSRS